MHSGFERFLVHGGGVLVTETGHESWYRNTEMIGGSLECVYSKEMLA